MRDLGRGIATVIIATVIIANDRVSAAEQLVERHARRMNSLSPSSSTAIGPRVPAESS